VLKSASDLDQPAVRDLLELALAQEEQPFDRRAAGRLIIKSISVKQRPRRPG
jgi:hypothetical protein